MKNKFSELNLHPQLVQAVNERGYDTPTPIQEGVIPVMLTGRDVIGQAQTGTGKTAAFSLPILHNIQPKQRRVQALVLAPTRELAMQVAQTIEEYGRYRNVSVLAVYGGQPYGQQIRRLRKGVDVVVGTPGRLLDLIKKKVLDLSHVATVVLDEADEMLSMGFIEDIELILKETPVRRQTALFSATLPSQIRKLAERYMRDPEAITIEGKQRTVAAVEQRYYLVYDADKLAALTRILEVETMDNALIFARTRVSTAELASELVQRGYTAEVLNGDLSQDAREQVLQRFRDNQVQMVVATDVAARGLDVDDISHVFNYDLPTDPEMYVHRIGRTGRAGRSGVAISFVTSKERGRLHKIERYTRQAVTQATLPTEADIHAYREGALLEQMEMWLQRGRCNREREMVRQMADAGHDLEEIAAAALKIARAEEKQRPIEPVGQVKMKSRGRKGKTVRSDRPNGNGRSRRNKTRKSSHEKGMVRLFLNAGKAHGVRPGDVVSTIAHHADIPGSTIGAIHIEKQHTLVDVPETLVGQVLDNSGNYQIHRQTVTVERAH